ISECQRRALDGLNCVATIGHGLDLENFQFNDTPQDYLVYLGRFTPGKGILEAIEVARRTGLRLRIAAPENEYYYEAVKQHVDGQLIEYLGELGHTEKTELLGNARALVYPIQQGEPFGLVLIEAMACGTPVAALDKGAVPEIVIDGVSGYATETLDQLIAKLPEVMALPRAQVRRHVEERFSVEAMTDGYEALYYRLVAERETDAANNLHSGFREEEKLWSKAGGPTPT